MTKDEAAMIFFVAGALNIIFSMIIPAMKERRAYRYAIRAIDKKYLYRKLELDIHRRRWQDDWQKLMFDVKSRFSKTQTQPNNMATLIPAPQKIN